MIYVAVYEVERLYGGPEEGGWWFNAGELVVMATFQDTMSETAERVADAHSKRFPRTGRQYSVLGGEDYNVILTNELPPERFPEEYPTYS